MNTWLRVLCALAVFFAATPSYAKVGRHGGHAKVHQYAKKHVAKHGCLPQLPINDVTYHIPNGAKLDAPDARVVLYFFGWDKEAKEDGVSGFEAKASQIFGEFEGEDVVEIIPDIGSFPHRSGCDGPLRDFLADVYAKIKEKTGIDVSKKPMFVVGYSGGAQVMAAFLRQGLHRQQLDNEESAIVWAVGTYGNDLDEIATKTKAKVVSIASASDTPVNNERFAEKVFINLAKKGVHNSFMRRGYIRQIYRMTKPVP